MRVLSAENVNKSYGKHLALDNMSFELRKGEIHTILGTNGSGKTTFIKVLATLLTKDSGIVNIGGYDLDTDANIIRRLIGYVGQDTERSAYARLTVRENLIFFGRLTGLSKQEISNQIDKLSTYLDFSEHLNKQFMQLSGGQKQTVVIMRALLHDPEVIYLDEPTKGLDPVISRRVREFIKSYVRDEGKSIILTSHILTEVEDMTDRVSLMRKGTLLKTGTIAELKSNLGAVEFIDIPRADLPPSIQERITALPEVTSTIIREEEDTVSFGITNLYDGMGAVISELKEGNIHTTIQHRQLTLEDLFVQLYVKSDENLEYTLAGGREQ